MLSKYLEKSCDLVSDSQYARAEEAYGGGAHGEWIPAPPERDELQQEA